jgi:hypothetical protein
MNHKPTRPTVGPRGGRTVQGTPCSECVSWRSCRPAAISEPFGCESWADQDGRRALPDELEPAPVPQSFRCNQCPATPRSSGPCNSSDCEFKPVLSNPDPEPEPFRPAAPFVPDPSRGEATAQAVLPMADAGPLFAGCLEARR